MDSEDSCIGRLSTNTLEVCRRAGIFGESPAFRQCLCRAEQAASAERTNGKLPVVFLCGETGTGKSALGRLIHTLSNRAHLPFHELDCAAVPHALTESVLFGYSNDDSARALTGKAGLLGLAGDGTLFLDEIGRTGLEIQSKLVSVLDSGEFTPVASSARQRTNCQLIFATREHLEVLVEKGSLLAELWHRTCAITVMLPPLRDRPDDIPLIAESLIAGLNTTHATCAPKHISPKALELLHAYRWPGNVRELIGCIQVAYALTPEEIGEIDANRLPDELTKY